RGESGATNDNLNGGRTCCYVRLRRRRVDEIASDKGGACGRVEDSLLIRFWGRAESGIAIRMLGLGAEKVAGMGGGDSG
ncbi:hypothetical protein A2U01_0043644, partial [Trifolium medium]|nr:hypothetical protein [Trifolium medium]